MSSSVSLALFISTTFYKNVVQMFFPEMEITKSKALYPKRAKPGLNINDMWEALESEAEAVFCPQLFVIYKFQKRPSHSLSLWGTLQGQGCAACGQGLLILGKGGCSEMSLGTSIPAPAGILSLSAGSLDELAVIVTSADLESHWLPLL